jgi:hypothetical protein
VEIPSLTYRTDKLLKRAVEVRVDELVWMHTYQLLIGVPVHPAHSRICLYHPALEVVNDQAVAGRLEDRPILLFFLLKLLLSVPLRGYVSRNAVHPDDGIAHFDRHGKGIKLSPCSVLSINGGGELLRYTT